MFFGFIFKNYWDISVWYSRLPDILKHSNICHATALRYICWFRCDWAPEQKLKLFHGIMFCKQTYFTRLTKVSTKFTDHLHTPCYFEISFILWYRQFWRPNINCPKWRQLGYSWLIWRNSLSVLTKSEIKSSVIGLQSFLFHVFK